MSCSPVTVSLRTNVFTDADLKAPPTLYLLSSRSSKESIASVARALVTKHRGEAPENFRLSVSELGLHLESKSSHSALFDSEHCLKPGMMAFRRQIS